jgi:hypothetical protein
MRVRFDEDARREYLDATLFYSESGEKVWVKYDRRNPITGGTGYWGKANRAREGEWGIGKRTSGGIRP